VATSNVGTYAIAQATLAASSNYALSYTGANLTVGTAALTVTADALSRAYGAANPTLTYTASGLVNGDTLSGALATSAVATSNVGIYAIVQGTLANANYAIGYNGANLTVTTAVLTVTADALSRAYGAANPSLTYSTSGLSRTSRNQ
jgi:predicted nucleic acid-binding protein